MFICTLSYEVNWPDDSEAPVNKLRPKRIIRAKQNFVLKFFILINFHVYFTTTLKEASNWYEPRLPVAFTSYVPELMFAPAVTVNA